MLFNSIDFAIFLPVVFLLYWFVFKNLKLQNIFILFCSYFFYAYWDYWFLTLIIISTVVDYLSGLYIYRANSLTKKNLGLVISLCSNLGILFFFKYFDFFVESFSGTFKFFGSELDLGAIELILPVGISFYTLQTLSYTIDIYRNKTEPTNNFISFASFVAFFPQLVAGPIERAKNLLPQFEKKRSFQYEEGRKGVEQILWGLFKKLVIADNCGYFVDIIFNNPESYSSSTLMIGAFLFSFQIYGDFSGYSDIAIGTARLFGFKLMVNFRTPYFAENLIEFWRRWHISLSTWFRDYLYIPLGGNRFGRIKTVRNIFIVFVLSGLWHGANWTFLIWGILHAVFFVLSILVGKKLGAYFNFPGRRIMAIMATVTLVSFLWIFFRSENLTGALIYIQHLFTKSIFSTPEIKPAFLLMLILILLSIDYLGRKRSFSLEILDSIKNKSFRRLVYFILVSLLGIFMYSEQTEFIYFQF